MQRAAQYLAKAEAAERNADLMRDERDRAALREIAARWRSMARQAAQLAQHESERPLE